jgi:hypothetical protein
MGRKKYNASIKLTKCQRITTKFRYCQFIIAKFCNRKGTKGALIQL